MTPISLHDAIFTTRAMRHLEERPVPRADLEYIVEAGTMAPSAGNLQLWSFVVVSDRQVMGRLADAHRDAGRQYIRDMVLADPEIDADRERVYRKAMHNVERLDEAGAIIVPCLTMPCPDDAGISSGLFGSIYPSIQNMLLAARSRGLGSVLITLASDYSPTHPRSHTPVREILGLPKSVASVALIPIGYPKGSWGRPWRKPWQQCIHWEHWKGEPRER